MQTATQATPVQAAAPQAANNAVATVAPTADPQTSGPAGLPNRAMLEVMAVPPLFERICTGLQTAVVTTVGGVILYDRFIGGK